MLYLVDSRWIDSNPHGSDETLCPFDKSLYSSDEQRLSLVTEWQQNAVAVAEAVVQHVRDDYKEFTELCLLFLDNADAFGLGVC